MSAYEPPTAVYPIFDSLAFQTPNSASLTLAEGDLRYLARQNIATSIASLTSFAGSIETPLINTASTINFTSSILDSNIDIGNGNLTNLFPTKNNIAIGSNIMSGAGLLTGAINNTGIGGSVLTGLTSGDRNVAIGHNIATGITTGSDNVILGTAAGNGITTGTNNICVGNLTGGAIVNGADNIFVGRSVGTNSAGGNDNVCIGNGANVETAFISSGVAIGRNTNVSTSGVSIGNGAGTTNPGGAAICIGASSGVNNQGANAISIGQNSGNISQGSSAIAIGTNAGTGITSGQGANSIAIGNNSGYNQQVAGSIILNASGSVLDVAAGAGFYVNPIRLVAPTTTAQFAFFNTSTKELGSTPYVNFFGPNITASVTLALPLSTIYLVTAGTPTITLPTASATYIGAKLTFRRVVATNIFTFNQTGGASVMVGYNAVTGAASFTMSALQFSSTIICDGTNWFQLQTA